MYWNKLQTFKTDYKQGEPNMMYILHKLWLRHVNIRIRRTAEKIGNGFRNNSIESRVNRNTIIGEDVSFNGIKIIGEGPVIIGNRFHCGEGCYIISENHDYDEGNELPYDSLRSITKKVIIEDNVWLGVCVIILPGAHIKEGAIIQAGSVVSGEIAKCGIAGGHPATVFKYRNISHYEELKRMGKFVHNNPN